MRSSRPSSLVACSSTASGMPASAILVRYSSTTEPESSPSSRWIDSICLRRKYSRCCFSAPSRTSSRILLAQLQLGQPLALEADGELEPLGHVERLEHPHLVLERDVGRVADGVGQRAGLADRAQPGADAIVDAAQLEDLLDHRAVLALEIARAAVDGDVVGRLGRPRCGGGRLVGVGGPGDAAGDAGELRRLAHRRAGGRGRSPRRWCRPWRIRCRAAGSGGRDPRHRRRRGA